MPTVTVENVRLSYPNLFTPTQYKNKGDFKYRLAVVIDKNTNGYKKLNEIAEKILQEEFPDGDIPKNFRTKPFYNAEEKYPDDSRFTNCVIANASNHNKPPVVDANMEKVIDPSLAFPGALANVALSVFTYPSSGNKEGITVGLEAVQLIGGGERLDNRPSVDDLFKPIEVEEGTAYNPLA